MRVEGAILPIGTASRVNRTARCELIDNRPEFRRRKPKQATNPFTGEPMVAKPTPDVASVFVDGISVGDVGWSMDEETPLVNISIERPALALVFEWAAELGGEFQEDLRQQ